MKTIPVWKYQKYTKTGPNGATTDPKAQRDILRAFSIFSQPTADQLSRFLARSLTYVQRNLAVLVRRRGYLTTLLPPKQTRYGSTPFVYRLTGKGHKYLTNKGWGVPSRFRPSEEKRRKGGPILHSLAVNEILLQALLLPRVHPDISLLEFVTERQFASAPLKVTLPGASKPMSLSPDLWLHFRWNRTHVCLCIELQLSRGDEERWRHKVRSYYYCLPSYKERFGTDAIVVAVLVASSLDFPRQRPKAPVLPEEQVLRAEEQKRQEKILEDFLHWTKNEFEELNAMQEADLFCLSIVSPPSLNPSTLFLQSRFFRPGETSPVALIPPDVVRKEMFVG